MNYAKVIIMAKLSRDKPTTSKLNMVKLVMVNSDFN